MSNANVDRVREDLAVMRQALGKQLPYGPKQVRDSLILAVAGAVIAAITGLTGIAALPAEPGSPRNLLYGALIVAPVLLLCAAGGATAYRRKAAHPLAWRDMRKGLVTFVLVLPLFFGFLYWSAKNGQPVATFINAGVIFSGLFWLFGAFCDERYRYYWGWGISTLLFGAIMPLGSYQTAGIFAGCWLLLGGLSTAGIMARQLRKERERGND
ncbi:MAG: hypothetical protein ACLP9L_40840 [Thermoguttaceae bacterium]